MCGLSTKCFAPCGAVLYSRKCSATNVDTGGQACEARFPRLRGLFLFTQKYLLDSMKLNSTNSTGFEMLGT